MNIVVRPVYLSRGRYALKRGYAFGIYVDGVLSFVTLNYPSWLNKGA